MAAGDPAGGAYSAPPDPLAAIRGPTSKGRGGKGRGGEGRGGEWRGGEGGREGRISPYQSTFASGAHGCNWFQTTAEHDVTSFKAFELEIAINYHVVA